MTSKVLHIILVTSVITWQHVVMFPENIKEDFLHGKSDFLSSLKNHIKEGHHTLLYAWGATMHDRRTFP